MQTNRRIAIVGGAPGGLARDEETVFVRAADAAQGAHEGLDFVSDDALEHFRSVMG